MVATRIYSCNFCRSKEHGLVGVIWVSRAREYFLEMKPMDDSHIHLCSQCVHAIAALAVNPIEWQNQQEPE
jgi:hypothetical protein